jgi:hypothetical protein
MAHNPNENLIDNFHVILKGYRFASPFGTEINWPQSSVCIFFAVRCHSFEEDDDVWINKCVTGP